MSDVVNELRRLAILDHSHVLGDVMREAADEIDTLRSRVICELADDDDEASHECGWQVCGVCWNNAAAAHKKVVDQLQAEIARLRKLCEPVSMTDEEQQFWQEHDTEK